MRMAASILANNPTLTLQEIIDDSVLQGFSRISPTTLFRYLQLDLKITRKRLNRWSQYRNTLNVKIQRINFFNMLSQIHSNLIWIDEFSVNLQITRNYGQSEMGERAVMVLPPNLGVNMNVCIAVDCDGLVYFECSIGGFDQVSFEIFLSNMTPQISQIKKNQGIFIIIDNAPPHTEKVFNDYLMFTNFMGDYLPPYSPMLTPIEEAISLIKNEIRTKLNTNDRLKLLNLINVPRGQKKNRTRKFFERCDQ